MKFFDELGRDLLERWRKIDFDHVAFPELAVAALRDRPPSESVDPMDVVAWALTNHALPKQQDASVKFGEPAITVFRCDGFYIEVLFWVDGTTAIHQHAFGGAFHVLQGSSIESVYDFEAGRRMGDHLILGKLALQSVDLLRRGSIRPIVAGRSFIHALFHLERPSVSVVVRTPTDPLAGPQYSYSLAGVAFDQPYQSDAMRVKVEALELLRTIGHPDFEEQTRATIAHADSFLAFEILTRLRARFEDVADYVAFVRSMPLDVELAQAILAHAAEMARTRHVVERRRLAQQSEHRFFLAVLLNLRDRTSILEMVKKAFPDRDPVVAVTTWLEELARLDRVHAWVAEEAKVAAKPILDVELDRSSLELVAAILRGDGGALTDRRVGLAASPLLGSLFEERRC